MAYTGRSQNARSSLAEMPVVLQMQRPSARWPSGRGTVRPGRCVYAGPGAESLPNVIINRDWTVHVQRSAAAGLLVHAGIEFLSENGEFLAYSGSKRPILKQGRVVISGSGESAAVVVNIERPKNLWWVPEVAVRCAGFNSGSMLPMSPATMLAQYRALANQAGVILSDHGAAFVLVPNVVLGRDWMVQRSADLLVQAGIEFLGENGKPTCVKAAASWHGGQVQSGLR
jgi:hypothetical protein